MDPCRGTMYSYPDIYFLERPSRRVVRLFAVIFLLRSWHRISVDECTLEF